jgi:hypothetical protein
MPDIEAEGLVLGLTCGEDTTPQANRAPASPVSWVSASGPATPLTAYRLGMFA